MSATSIAFLLGGPRPLRQLAAAATLFLTAHAASALVDERVHLEGGMTLEATFNRPGFDDSASRRLEDRVIQMIGDAIPGSSIFVSIYTFGSATIAEALLEAHERQVTVQVIADRKSLRKNRAALDRLRKGEQRLTGCDGSCVIVCRAGCNGLHINHNKFLLFSALRDGSRWVVAQTSANFTKGQRRHYNDLLVIKNDRALYDAFQAYFDDLSDRRLSPRYYRRSHGDSGVVVSFFPRLFGPDPIVELLRDVECETGSILRVAHSRFDSFRAGVARQLRKLANEGCDVEVVLREELTRHSPGRAVLRELGDLATVLPYRGSSRSRNAIHTKLMLVKAPTAEAGEPRHLVITGSHNLSVTSLHLNDEVLLHIDNENLFTAYQDFFREIVSEHERR